MVKQKQKQSQKVVVNINTGKAKGKRKRKAKPKKALPQYIKYPNSIGYALNNQMYQMSQPKMIDYNLALAQANVLREQQMRTGSLIPNQQINSLTPIATAVAYNPFSVESTNNQANMLDPTESLVEEVVEAETTELPTDSLVVKLSNVEKDLSYLKPSTSEYMINKMSADLLGANRKISQSIGESLVTDPKQKQQLKEKVFSKSENLKMSPEEKYEYEKSPEFIMSKQPEFIKLLRPKQYEDDPLRNIPSKETIDYGEATIALGKDVTPSPNPFDYFLKLM